MRTLGGRRFPKLAADFVCHLRAEPTAPQIAIARRPAQPQSRNETALHRPDLPDTVPFGILDEECRLSVVMSREPNGRRPDRRGRYLPMRQKGASKLTDTEVPEPCHDGAARG